MQIFRTLKTFLRYYFRIIPIYLLVNTIRGASSSLAPMIGPVLLLPLKVSISHSMLMAHIDSRNRDKSHLSVASENGNYFRNLLYMFVKDYLYTVPISVVLGIFLFRKACSSLDF